MSKLNFDHLKRKIGQDMHDSPSPFARWLNGRLEKIERGYSLISFSVIDEMSNPLGTLHGGVVAAIIDEVVGLTIVSLDLLVFYTTVNLSVDFLEPVKIGSTIFAETTIVRQGKKIINAECVIKFGFENNERIIAKGTTNLIATSISIY